MPGERYSVLREQVLYFDAQARRVRLVDATGAITDHPFIQLPGAAQRVDWLAAPGGAQIAWSLSEATADGRWRSHTRVAATDGSAMREVLVDGPHAERHAVPVAFSDDGATLYMNYRPAGAVARHERQGYADLFALNLAEGFTRRLPGEPGCLCGAAFADGRLLRLQPAGGSPGGLELVQRNSGGELSVRIAAPALPGFTQARHLLLTPDGSRALYTLAQVRDGGVAGETVRTVFVLADLNDRSSRILGEPVDARLGPIAWSEGGRMAIVTAQGAGQDGTWKLDLAAGTLRQVASAGWLGSLAG